MVKSASPSELGRERGGVSGFRPSDGSQGRLTFWVRSEAPPPLPSEPGGLEQSRPCLVSTRRL